MYEIRDHTHPETHPLGIAARATAATYAEALAVVDRLHHDFHGQLQASGEGAAGRVKHRLVVVDVTRADAPLLAGIHQYTPADVAHPYQAGEAAQYEWLSPANGTVQSREQSSD